jgi:hypothetical protein
MERRAQETRFVLSLTLELSLGAREAAIDAWRLTLTRISTSRRALRMRIRRTSIMEISVLLILSRYV